MRVLLRRTAGAWAAVLAASLGSAPSVVVAEAAEGVAVYSHLLAPREHPDYERRAVRPPDWDTFGRRTQFTTLRGFPVQDGRIVGYADELEKFTRAHELGNVIWPSYANQLTPASAGRLEQYLNFQRHFERMGDDLGHRHATLVSLNFGHYFLKEGTYTLIGAETVQALPNNQVYYAFIRGAGKQYGVPWFGNASIFNRWGYKVYGSAGRSDGYDFGPTRGTSLSLLKRLLYSHILCNSVAAGFENGWFDGDQLSPIGRIQQAANRWVGENGPPGVQHTPVAVLVDFLSGWSFPRHLYSEHVYRVWGNLPYGPGDHLTDAVLDLLYPGYQDSS